MNRRFATPPVLAVVAFTVLYTLVAGGYSLTAGNYEFLLYVLVMFVAGAGIAILHARVGLTTGALWCLSVWGLLHMLGGLVVVPESWPVNGPNRVLYSWWLIPERLKYDHLVHAYGFGVATWVAWQGMVGLVRRGGGRLRPTFGGLVLAAAAGLGFGALNEIIEFAVTLLVPETNVGGYINTGWDLVSNLVGALVAVILIRVSSRGE